MAPIDRLDQENGFLKGISNYRYDKIKITFSLNIYAKKSFHLFMQIFAIQLQVF